MKFNIDIFINDSNKVHNENYVYDRNCSVSKKTDKIKIFCQKCNQWFEQDYIHHVKRKQGCPFCNKNERKTTEIFIKDSINIFGNRFDYQKTEYKNCMTKVCLICHKKDKYGNEHGEFWVTPNTHLSNKSGCPKCAGRIKKTLSEFINDAREIHGDKYDYSKVNYVNNQTKVCIICPEHGEFWQMPNHHLKGSGCPKCNQSHLEREIMQLLEENNIIYEYQKRFEWLGKQSLDFYLPEYNIAIECQGIQHFEPIDFAGKGENWAKQSYKENIERDKRKKEICEKHNVPIYYINYNDKIKNKLYTIL